MFTFDKDARIKEIKELTTNEIAKLIIEMHNDNYLFNEIDLEKESNEIITIGYYKYILTHWKGYRKNLYSEKPFIAADIMNLYYFNALALGLFLVSDKIIYVPVRDIGILYGEVLPKKRKLQEVIDTSYKQLVALLIFMDLLDKNLIEVEDFDPEDTEFKVRVRDLLDALERNKDLIDNVKGFVISLLEKADEEKMKRRFKVLTDTLKTKDINDIVALVDETGDDFEASFVNHCIDMLKSLEQSNNA